MKKNLSFLLLLFTVLSCNPEEITNTEDPSNLIVEITLSDEHPGEILIQASADNTIEYRFYIGASETAIDSNATGSFQYTFTNSGIYDIEIRAYGLSGRYVKKEQSISIELNDEVPLENGYTSPTEYEGYTLIWYDEFNDASINTNYWSFETGNGCPYLCGWGNNELQYYRSENTQLGDGTLTIEAKKEAFSGSLYTSSRIISKNNFSFQYGRVDIRALLPEGQGIWPALWMLGNNIDAVPWPGCGEIDIMEMVGGSGRENTVHGTVHWDYDGHAHEGGSKTLSSGTFADKYHVFSIIWDEQAIRWYVDNQLYHQQDISADHMSEFHNKFFFILNIAVGGNWPGNPDETTVFPQEMKVDYIRVFQTQSK